MSHSPAPWTFVAEFYDEDGDVCFKEMPYDYRSGRFVDNPYIHDANGNMVAGCDEYYAFSKPENVRLMVHAPELLDVLKDLLRDIDTIDSFAINNTVFPMWEDIERARALVAKMEVTL